MSVLVLHHLVPLVGHSLLPVFVLLEFLHAVFDDGEGRAHLIIFKVLFIVEVESKLDQLFDFLLLLLLLLLLGGGPGRAGLFTFLGFL